MITFKDNGGVASHKRVAILVDGEKRGEIYYSGYRSGNWRIIDLYHNTVGFGRTLDAARERVATLSLPSKRECYEQTHRHVYETRLKCAERAFGHELAELTRAVVAGSNSAREEMEAVLAKIDLLARQKNVSLNTNDTTYPLPPGWSFEEFRDLEIVDREPMPSKSATVEKAIEQVNRDGNWIDSPFGEK